MDGDFQDGDQIPPVRQYATVLSINPLTVTRAYQSLVDENILEKRRGLGVFVREGAIQTLIARERKRFIEQEWPKIQWQMQQLGLTISDLPNE